MKVHNTEVKLCSDVASQVFENISLKHVFRWEAPLCLLHKEDITCSISSQRYFVQLLVATTWQYIEHILGIFWLYLGHILIISWPHLEDILSISSYSYSHFDLLIISIRTEDFLFQQNKLYVLFQLLYISSSLNLQTSLFFPSSLDNFIQN